MTIELSNNRLFNLDSSSMYNRLYSNINKLDYNVADSNRLKKLLKNIFLDEAKNYKVSYICNIIETFTTIFSNIENYKLDLEMLDRRKYDATQNEYIFIVTFLCFKFAVKIISDRKNGLKASLSEINNSIFIKNNFILTDECPHFACLITDIAINKYFNKIELKSSVNYGLVFDYINPWIINVNSEYYSIGNLEDLFKKIHKFKSFFPIEYINNILYNVFFQIFYSLCALSKYRINHNDLRPANILIHGNYDNLDKYDVYTVEGYDYYILNLGFKVKIIDFGLTNSDMIDKLNNNKSVSHSLVIEAGIFKYYSKYYDIHYLINDIFSRIRRNQITNDFYDFIIGIIDSKYIGTYPTNPYLNEYWRLAFPFTIKEYIKYYGLNIKLLYDSKNNLIVDEILIEKICNHIKHITRREVSDALKKNLSDPIDNNKNKLKDPFEVIRLFKNYMTKNKDLDISNKYVLNMEDDKIFNLEGIE